MVFDDGQLDCWYKYSKKQNAILKKNGFNADLASVMDHFIKACTNSSSFSTILRNFDNPRHLAAAVAKLNAALPLSQQRKGFSQTPQIMTQHEFGDMSKLLLRDLQRPVSQKVEEDPLLEIQERNAEKMRLALPERFTLQAYIQPKLDARYITYFNDHTNDRLMGLRPNIDFEVTASNYHSNHRIDDYYTKIKIQKMYQRYTQEMMDSSITQDLVYKLYKAMVNILHFVGENHQRIMSCEMEWIREEESGTLFLTDMRNIILAKQNNRAFTNSLYRHMKRNMVAILDEEKREQDEAREAELEQKYAVIVTSLQENESKKKMLLPPRHSYMKRKQRYDPSRKSHPIEEQELKLDNTPKNGELQSAEVRLRPSTAMPTRSPSKQDQRDSRPSSAVASRGAILRQNFSQSSAKKSSGSREAGFNTVSRSRPTLTNNPRIDLLNEHQQKSDLNFFHLLDEAQENWKDRLETLETKGVRQKRNLKDQIKRETEVMNFKIEQEGNEKLQLETQIEVEEKRIMDLNSRLKFAVSQMQNMQDMIHYENRCFTEKVEKIKKDKEQPAMQSVHLQNSVQNKLIDQLEVRLKNQKLEHQLQEVRRKDGLMRQNDFLETNFREDVLNLFHDMVKQYKACQEDIFVLTKKPLVSEKDRKKLKELRARGNMIENQILIIKQESQVPTFNFYEIA